MSRGPPHRYTSTGERFRGYPPRYEEFSGSPGYGYYGGPPYKRQRRHSSDDEIGPPPPVTYGPAYYDPPYVRHQEVGLGEFNDFSSVSVDKDIKIHDRDVSRRDHERSESSSKKRQSSTEGSGHPSQQQSTNISMSPHSSKVSPRFSPRQSPRAGPVTPPSSSGFAATQQLLIATSQPASSSKGVSISSSDDGILVSQQPPLLTVWPTTSQSAPGYGPGMGERLKDSMGRPTSISSLSPHGGLQRKESYPGPTVEAISPSAPASESRMDKDGEKKKEVKDEPSDMMSKDELLQGMEKVDREIAQVNQQISNLKKMQKQLEDEASKRTDEPKKEEMPALEVKPKSLVQIIYEENRKKAEAAQARLAKLGFPLPGGKPLYNQPSDLQCYHENLRKAPAIKAKLVKYFQLRKQAKEIKNRQLCKEYRTLKQAWLKKIERHENNPKRKQKEAKLREFYEKVFPEIKKQREQTERFTRMGSRSNWGIVARSEAEFNEIVDNLNEQEANERHMRTLAVEPPPILDKEERRLKFINRNGLIRDPLATLNERKHRNIWTEKERQLFKDKFVLYPKDFDLISSFLPGKSVADCILFYYQTKKKEHYKQLSRRHNLKKRRRDQFAATREGAPPNKTRAGASEMSSAKGDRGGSEGEEYLEEMTDSAEESEENEENPPPPVTSPQVTTPAPPARRPDHVETSRWSEKEIEIALQGLRECGRDWESIARRVVTKTGAQCKNFYFNYKKKLHLEDLIAEHEKAKMQRAQQKQQREQQQQRHHHLHHHQQQPQQQSQQKDSSSAVDKHEPTPKLGPGAQRSDTSHPNQSDVKLDNTATSNMPSTNSRDATSVVVGTTANPTESSANVPTASTTSSNSSLQLGSSRIARSQSPRLPHTSSSSTLFMPTPGVIASIGRASPNVGSTQQGQGFLQPVLIESMKKDAPHSSRALHPDSILTGLVYPRALDPSHLRHGFPVSSHPGHSHSDSQSFYQGSPFHKQPSHSTSSHRSSNIVLSTKDVPRSGSSYAGTSNPGTFHVTASHLGSSQCGIPQQVTSLHTHPGISHTERPTGPEPSHAPVSSILFTPSGPSSSAPSHRSRPGSQSPVFVVSQDKTHSQVTFLKEGSAGHSSSHKPTYLSTSTYPGNVRGEPVGRIIMKTEDVRRDISPEVHSKPMAVPEPDIIVIDVDDQKKRVEGYPRPETAEGNQASSMLRRLASAGNAPSAEHALPVTEPVRPQSLPLSSDTHLMSHTESRKRRSATPPSISSAMCQVVLNRPPPLIQVSSRERKNIVSQDIALESSRPREGSVRDDPNQDRYLHHSQEATSGRDVPRHTHTPVDNRGSERERRTPVVETVDLTKEREVSTSPLTRPSSRSRIALGSSSARATLQAMAMCASSENKSADDTEKIAQNKREETYLPPRAPDTKLSAYEQKEAIRKFQALRNVCVSVSREFATGENYSTQPYSLMALQAQHQPHVHPHPAGTSTPPPYGYPFHMPHPVGSYHHHPDHPFLVPVVHHLPHHSVNGEELPSHIKLSGTYAHQYPQGVSYFPAGVRAGLPTYQPMPGCRHRNPVPSSEERRAVPHPLEVPARRENDISDQDLAHPFVVRQSKLMQAQGVSERTSPGELPNISLSRRSPHEPVKRPHTISPETKPHVSQHAEAAKAVSPPAATYLSRIPSRPASVSEMRNRAAVIPDLNDTDVLMSQKFPEPQPVIVPASKHSSRDVDSRTEHSGSSDIKGPPTENKESTLAEVFPMSAFEALVDVAAAARKVDIPFYAQEHERLAVSGDTTQKKEKSSVQETRGSHCHSMTSPSRLSSPHSPTRVSPGVSGAPRYGITTGLVPKPPPLMPITGMRSLQEGSSSSSIPLSVSVGGHPTSISRSASKVTSPSVSPDGPPPLISTSVISPTGSSQGASPNGPPPLIRGIVSPGPTALRSPEREADSTVKTRSNPDALPKRRPEQASSVSKGILHEDKTIPHIDPDFKRKFWMHLNESVPLPLEKADDDTNNTSSTPHRPGHSHVRTIVETRAYLDSARAETSHPALHPSVVVQPEQYQPLPSSSSSLILEHNEATRVREVPRSFISEEINRNIQGLVQPEQSRLAHGHGESWQVNKRSFEWKPKMSYPDKTTSSPLHNAPLESTNSCASGSETEEGEEGEPETETLVHVSPVSIHPRVLALARNSQRNSQSCYDASDSETLSAEESEHLPESSDEMFPSTTTNADPQADDLLEDRGDNEREVILRDNTSFADSCDADTNTPLPSRSLDYSNCEDENTPKSLDQDGIQKSHVLQDTVTSTRPVSPQLPVSINDQATEDLPTTSFFPEETSQLVETPQVYAEMDEDAELSLDQENSENAIEASGHESTPSQISCPNESPPEEDSSEALPASNKGVEQMDVVRVQSSEDTFVGSSDTDIAPTLPQVVLSCQQVSEGIPDSSANTLAMPDENITSSLIENFQDRDMSVTAIVTSNDIDDKITADQSLIEDQSVFVTAVTDADVYPSTSGTTKDNTVSLLLDQRQNDEEIIDAETLEHTRSETEFPIVSDAFSTLSEKHPPAISSAMDDVSDDDDHSSYPTFVGEYVPPPREVDFPDIRFGCSTHVASETSSIGDDGISERELNDEFEPAPLNQEEPPVLLSPNGRANNSDDALSEGEIPPSQEGSQSEDELLPLEEKSANNEAAAILSSEPIEHFQSNCLPNSLQSVNDRDRIPSQSNVSVDDEQLSEGEIPESEAEATEETSQGSPASVGGADVSPVSTRRASVVSSSQETTLSTDCYINMIPISPAPPESPSHESESDGTSLLPQWPSIDNQYSLMSLPLTSRITPFPYSTLSLNVGSANSSARSSPVPSALAVSFASGSSPSSSSLLPRPQEPTLLLSDNYEPLSDDDDNGVVDTPCTSEDNL